MLSGYKTYITAAVAVIGALGAWASGDATAFQAASAAVNALLAAFIRAGVAKV